MIFILFWVSLIVLCTMVASKIFAIKVRRIHFLETISAKGDAKIHRAIEVLIFKYNRYQKIAHLFVFDFLPAYLYEVLVKLKDWVAKKYYLAGDQFRGRRILRNNGSVSHFLQNITDEKGGVSDNKI